MKKFTSGLIKAQRGENKKPHIDSRHRVYKSREVRQGCNNEMADLFCWRMRRRKARAEKLQINSRKAVASLAQSCILNTSATQAEQTK